MTAPGGLDLPRVELLLREAVAAVRAMGWTVRPGLWVQSKEKACCPIGAVWLVYGRLGEGYAQPFTRIARCANISRFILGFDGVIALGPMSELGARLRREWVPT